MITSKESTLDNHKWMNIQNVPLYIVVSSQHRLANHSALNLAAGEI